MSTLFIDPLTLAVASLLIKASVLVAATAAVATPSSGAEARLRPDISFARSRS